MRTTRNERTPRVGFAQVQEVYRVRPCVTPATSTFSRQCVYSCVYVHVPGGGKHGRGGSGAAILNLLISCFFSLKHANFGLFLSPHRASRHSHLPDTSQRHLHASQKPFSSEKRARPPRVGLADWPRNPSRDPFKTRIHD